MAEIPSGSPFHVEAAHDGVNALGIRLRVTNQPPAEAQITAGKATFPFPSGLPIGAYTLEARAYNAQGESSPLTEPLTISAVVPAPPTSITVLAQAGQAIPVTITVVTAVPAPPTALAVHPGVPPPQPSGDPHGDFERLVKSPFHFISYSFRDPAQVGKFWITYDPASDTQPDRQDAAKVTIPAFRPLFDGKIPVHILEPMTATQPTMVVSGLESGFQSKRVFKIDDEIVQHVSRVGNVVTVTRGMFGSAASSHAAGAPIRMASNTVPDSIHVPIGTTDGHTWLFIWETYWTESFLDCGRFTHKYTNLLSSANSGTSIWYEPRAGYGSPTFPNPDWIASHDVRTYNRPYSGAASWADTDGSYLGPGAIKAGDSLGPKQATFGLKAKTWTKFAVEIQQRANDYDPVSMWLLDETRGPVQTLRDVPISVIPTGKHPNKIPMFVIEFNTSTDTFFRLDQRDLVAYFCDLVVLQDAGDPLQYLTRPQPKPYPPSGTKKAKLPKAGRKYPHPYVVRNPYPWEIDPDETEPA